MQKYKTEKLLPNVRTLKCPSTIYQLKSINTDKYSSSHKIRVAKEYGHWVTALKANILLTLAIR